MLGGLVNTTIGREAESIAAASADTLTGLILARARAMPDAVFCRFLKGGGEQVITRGALVKQAERYAAALNRNGIEPGAIVPIILDHRPDLFFAFFGAMLCGGIPAFLAPLTRKQDPAVYWSGHHALLERIGAGMLVTIPEHARSLANALPDRTFEVLTTDDVLPAAAPAAASAWQACVAAPDDIAFLQHSSGTTGLKKGVALTHRGVLAQLRAYSRALLLKDDDSIASWLPLYHDMGLITGCILPAVMGVPVVAMDPLEWVTRPTMLLDAIEQHRCSLAWQPNFAFHHIVNAAPADARWQLSSIRAIVNCSETCRADTFDEFAGRFAPMGLKRSALQIAYAMAENVFAVTQTGLGEVASSDPATGLLSCGQPIEGVALRIVGPGRQPMPEGETGEIAISGASLFSGYFHDAATTAARLADGWYHTGDLGFVRDGELFVVGRRDDLLIVHGRKFYAHQIEAAANRAGGIIAGRCVALPVFDAGLGTHKAVMVAERQPAEAGTAAAAARAIRERVFAETGLQLHAVRFMPPGWLIKTTSGKISRAENLGKFLEQSKEEG